MVVDKREVVALFEDKLRKELEKDVAKLINKNGGKVVGVSVKNIKDGFQILFNCGSKDPINVGAYLEDVEVYGGDKKSKSEKIRIKFRPFAGQKGPGVSRDIVEEISEKDWKKKGLKIIETRILDIVEHAIERRFISFY
ncbi:hypothetical protein HYV89_02870 [Candidatus Woesearchaeota archaeon]|nr:hypothetical protein [Candidatus Woesearchaeota archaeon]